MKLFDPNDNEFRPLNEYTKRLPSSRAGKGINRSTVWRWALRGCAGNVLATFVIGGMRYTSDFHVAEFLKACTAARAERLGIPISRNNTQALKRRDHAALEEKLGIRTRSKANAQRREA
ncbi:MAG: DUF1580 domain-containing protein [Planctomycetes bacterium]|nr:DUF1580 domain-containing protein [Planctomycetota bacterium]